MVERSLGSQDGLAEHRLVRGGRGTLGLVEVAILEVGCVDFKIGGDAIPKLEQQGMDPKSAARSLCKPTRGDIPLNPYPFFQGP